MCWQLPSTRSFFYSQHIAQHSNTPRALRVNLVGLLMITKRLLPHWCAKFPTTVLEDPSDYQCPEGAGLGWRSLFYYFTEISYNQNNIWKTQELTWNISTFLKKNWYLLLINASGVGMEGWVESLRIIRCFSDTFEGCGIIFLEPGQFVSVAVLSTVTLIQSL